MFLSGFVSKKIHMVSKCFKRWNLRTLNWVKMCFIYSERSMQYSFSYRYDPNNWISVWVLVWIMKSIWFMPKRIIYFLMKFYSAKLFVFVSALDQTFFLAPFLWDKINFGTTDEDFQSLPWRSLTIESLVT